MTDSRYRAHAPTVHDHGFASHAAMEVKKMDVDRILQGAERQRRDADERRVEFFADDPNRDIPDLEFLTPDCSVCGQPTDYDEGFHCADCRIQWPRNGYGHKAERYADE